MQGGDNGEAEDQHDNGFEGVDEPPLPTLARENVIKVQENEVDMREERINGEKRGQSECGERPGNGKLRRREGIKRSFRDITPVSYEEYDNSWDLEDQSKKCKKVANCLLARCQCRGGSEPIGEEKGELPVHVLSGEVADGNRRAGTRDAERERISVEEEDLPVHLTPGAGAGMDGRASTRDKAGALPSLGKDNTGRYSVAAALSNTAQTAGSLNHTTDTVSQLYSKPRRLQSSWSQRILRTMITLMLFITSICAVEGNSDWRESAFKIQAFDCNAPTMINKLHLPDVCFILEKKLPEKLATAKPAWILGEIEVDEPVDLRTEENNLMISDELTMLFNVTKKDVLLLPGCPRLTLHHTALGTVSITFDKRAAGLPEVVSLDVRSDQDLIPTLKYLEHQNARALSDLNNRVEIDYQDHSELCVTEEPEERENRTSSDGTITHQRRESIIVKVSLICDNR